MQLDAIRCYLIRTKVDALKRGYWGHTNMWHIYIYMAIEKKGKLKPVEFKDKRLKQIVNSVFILI